MGGRLTLRIYDRLHSSDFLDDGVWPVILLRLSVTIPSRLLKSRLFDGQCRRMGRFHLFGMECIINRLGIDDHDAHYGTRKIEIHTHSIMIYQDPSITEANHWKKYISNENLQKWEHSCRRALAMWGLVYYLLKN